MEEEIMFDLKQTTAYDITAKMERKVTNTVVPGFRALGPSTA